MKRIIPLLVCLLLVVVSCKKDDPVPAIDWQSYYPLSIGTERIYDFTFIRIDLPAAINDTAHYFVREMVEALIADTNGCCVYAEKYEKGETVNGPWEPLASFSVQQYARKIVRVEENVPYQVLLFPAKLNLSWDMNIFNTFENQQVYYSNINNSNEGLCDSTITVLQNDFKSLYTYQFAEEQYGKNIGLISKVVIDVESQPNHLPSLDITKPIEERITKGSITKWTLVDFSVK